jgi:ABC-type dipeptide/oligopeptide/nickel transport system ATPase subunit
VSSSYKAERARGLFNVTEEDGSSFHLEADLPIEHEHWSVGVVVGSSGSGKSSIGAELIGRGWEDPFPLSVMRTSSEPIIDSVADDGFDKVTGVLSSVGLGAVPAWLRPYGVLSNGEKFRADLAWLLLWPELRNVVVDEFTSVLDRTVACTGAAAFAKAWRKQKGRRIVLLTCHHDILDWLEPDWAFDTDKQKLYLQDEDPVVGADGYQRIGRLVIKR